MPESVESKTVSVVIPVYFNEESLDPLFVELQAFEQALAARNAQLEVIFVDDGSGDGSFATLMRIKNLRPATKVIKLTRNFGALAASKVGFGYVTGDCFTILAADLQDPVEKVLEMVDRWLAGSKFVICVRADRSDPWLTKLFAAFYYSLLRLLVSENYPRGGFDMMLLDREFLTYMRASGRGTHPNLFAYWLGFRPEILYYSRRRRPFGRSRWTLTKKLVLFIDTLTGFSVVPIRLLSAIGVLTAFISFLYGAYMFVNALFGRIDVQGFPTIIVLVTFFSGLILVMLGVIGEYLRRIFDAAQNRPESVIEKILL
jgi:dolichol-phosphate mannosyltransferase